MLCSLLGATAEGGVLTWPGSSMNIELAAGATAADSHVVIEPPAATTVPLRGAVREAAALLRTATSG